MPPNTSLCLSEEEDSGSRLTVLTGSGNAGDSWHSLGWGSCQQQAGTPPKGSPASVPVLPPRRMEICIKTGPSGCPGRLALSPSLS